MSKILSEAALNAIKTYIDEEVAKKYTKPSSGIPAADLAQTYVLANTAIVGSTKCKITYDNKGLVTGGAALEASDIPNLSASKITSGTFDTARLPDNYGDTKNPYASKTKNYVLAAPNGSAGAPTFRALVAADLPSNYGDSKNPYASKTKNYVLAAPSSAAGAPSFRALVSADIPSLAASKITSGTFDKARIPLEIWRHRFTFALLFTPSSEHVQFTVDFIIDDPTNANQIAARQWITTDIIKNNSWIRERIFDEIARIGKVFLDSEGDPVLIRYASINNSNFTIYYTVLSTSPYHSSSVVASVDDDDNCERIW